MNRLTKSVFALLFVISGALLHSCQEELAEPAEEILLKSEAIEADCNDCFTPGGPYVEKHYKEVVTWGRKFSKTIDLVVYNTEDKFVLKLKNTHFMANIKVRFPGENSFRSIKNVRGTYPAGVWVTKTFDLPSWNACDIFSFDLEITGQGPKALIHVEYGLTAPCGEQLTVTDPEGNVYPVVKIGEQYWMAKNLTVTTYRNGDVILSPYNSNLGWLDLHQNEMGGVAFNDWYEWLPEIKDNNEVVEIFGRLYNGYAADDLRGICPAGWKVSALSDWNQLMDYLISNYNDVNTENISFKLRSTKWWYYPFDGEEFNGTDDFGFDGLPGGHIDYIGTSWAIGWSATWLTADGFYISLSYNKGEITINPTDKQVGLSIRCIKE